MRVWACRKTVSACFTQPYQNHASIGPSCAVADVQGNQATIYSSTQGVYPLRGAIAQLLGLAGDSVHVVHFEGSGCYGHNRSGRGQGIAFSRYENNEAYVATAADVSIDSSTGRIVLNRISVAHDCGLIINPDGLKNQIEGNVIQSASRAILEQVSFDSSRITSVDWRSYPILRFQDIPPMDITLINHPDQPAWGAGEVTTLTTPPAIANAIFHGTGKRLRSIPLQPVG